MVVAPKATARRAGQHRGLNRGSLTRELIVGAALRILDEGTAAGLTFARLGKELGASPTAVYRHFPSRESIVIAVADELIRLAIEDYEPSDVWEDSLRDLAERAWNTFAQHPAAAMHTFYRVTRGPHEIAAVDAILAAVHQAGWTGREAVLHYQTFSTLVLALSGSNAARLSASLDRAGEGPEWMQEYLPADPSRVPYVSALRDDLPQTDRRRVFQRLVEVLLDTMRADLPAKS
ncbi:AcrR family transcriptional regulator [Paenarthrobacter nitroguajacolicus]|uniref:TetR/AcrR family transcriptional regulator n=1 Tax=Paenarthrobacter nitroguajacolicus TaxID=211146 RepID=UPI002866B117|nr:TetR/AcrR family transcriptional regulator [Paenarthrobacter nitroguajacolicus]MDR6989140.1 AcrR family transcriptional regulator [Paenarthrobacter nitroguajacolicus]